MASKKFWLWIVVSIFILFNVYIFLEDKEQSKKAEEVNISSEITIMIDKALEAMKNSQRSNSGAIGQNYEVASTSLAGLAFLAAGYQAGKGKYGSTVKKAIEYLLRQGIKNKNGYFCEDGCISRMHGHGFALTFLAYAYGDACTYKQVDCDRYKNIMMKAIKLAEDAQSQNGGWLYDPTPSGDENSVTACIVMGLRAAKEAGFRVKKKTIDKGAKYIEQCAQPDGSFSYNLSGGRGTATLTGAGISDLFFYGRHANFLKKHKKIIERGIKFILDNKEDVRKLPYGMYALFYTTLAMYWGGGEYWNQWYKYAIETIKAQKREDGTISGTSYGLVNTGFATLILLIPKKILPLFDK